MRLIRDIRSKKGLSQRVFAKKALMSFRGLQLLEEHDHDWRLSSIRKVAGALGLPAGGIDLVIRNFLEQDRDSIVMVSIRIQADGPASWPLHLFNFVDAFRSSPKESLVQSPPVDVLEDRLKCLLASTVETLCADVQVNIPEWCYGVRGLKEPWFVAEIESLKAMALVESPVRFRKRNIFVLGNLLERV
jgi:transcriptional regulator with XRE-family HTH domain